MYPASKTISSNDIAEKLEALGKLTQLNPYETNLIQSLAEFHTKKGFLTERQYELLNKLTAQYSQEKLNEMQGWRESFTAEMRDKLNIVCEYYSKTGYFGSIVSHWQNDKQNYIPTKEQYEKISGNTYAKKVLENHSRPVEFNNGDLVSLRATYSASSISPVNRGQRYIQPRPSDILFVVDNKVVRDDLYRYCKVFAMNNPESLMLVREKDLKKYRGGK